MNKNMPWETLAKYFAGELNREDTQKMENWIKADPGRAKMVNELYHIWKESEIPPYELSVDDAWARLSDSIDNFEIRKKDKKRQASRLSYKTTGKSLVAHNRYTEERQHFGRSRRVIVAAASILILVSAGLFSFYLGTEQSIETIAGESSHVLTTEYGERATYTLSDGSRVILHAGSRLEIPENYNADYRELHLEGEAYFETAHDSDKPFIVHSGNSYTRVLGTRFLVQSWNRDGDGVEVVVSEGKVLFGDKRTLDSEERREIVLTQNQRGSLGSNQAPVIADITDIDWYLGWTEGRLVFENRPLREVLPRLERWYDLEIIVLDEEIIEQRITAEIDYTLSMSEVLEGMAMTFGLEMEREGRTVTFTKKDSL